MPAGFAVVGVHARLVDVFQSLSKVHPALSRTYHLNCAAPPPVAVAVSVIVVPGACGAVRSAVNVTAVIGAPMTYGRSNHFSGASVVVVSRAHSSIMPDGLGVDGVHASVVAVLQSRKIVQPVVVNAHHLNSTP